MSFNPLHEPTKLPPPPISTGSEERSDSIKEANKTNNTISQVAEGAIHKGPESEGNDITFKASRDPVSVLKSIEKAFNSGNKKEAMEQFNQLCNSLKDGGNEKKFYEAFEFFLKSPNANLEKVIDLVPQKFIGKNEGSQQYKELKVLNFTGGSDLNKLVFLDGYLENCKEE
ncbi:hypothetical protein AB751O23_CB_00030 [Chlamydiales bacterium SCGC AB-751-O23]|jgi:hypothetical protein|nr:hypothetical protein AB751O23_CB_00030 [Chlamydiales bacterium SCGC AB-751-O23]